MIEELDEAHEEQSHHRHQELLRIEAGGAEDDRLPHERRGKSARILAEGELGHVLRDDADGDGGEEPGGRGAKKEGTDGHPLHECAEAGEGHQGQHEGERKGPAQPDEDGVGHHRPHHHRVPLGKFMVRLVAHVM